MTSRISAAKLPLKAANKAKPSGEDQRVHKGRVVFGAMDEVVFGRPAAEAIVEQLDRLKVFRAFLMVSGTLNRETDEIGKIRGALGARDSAILASLPHHTHPPARHAPTTPLPNP